jgi:uncharacterized protein YndB with AHSA1/START domain
MHQGTLELGVTRFIAAPPAAVWDVMANRQEEWWCPVPWRVAIDAQDKRPGGVCDMTMHGPDGEVMPQKGIYLAWEEGRRFVTTDAVSVEGGEFVPAGPFMIGIWEIAPASEGGIEGTRYTARARHWKEEDLVQHRDMGFEAGWMACADQLAAICENGT